MKTIIASNLVALFFSVALNATTEKIVWTGKIEINEPTSIKSAISAENAEIIFKKSGFLICKEAFEAKNSVFRAEEAIEGKNRIVCGDVSLQNCEFKNMITTNLRFHNAFFRSFRGKAKIIGCVFENCSAVELTLTRNATISDCRFISPVGVGLALFHSSKTQVIRNTFKASGKTTCLLKLNQSDHCQIAQNRFFDSTTGIVLYNRSSDNQLAANSFFNLSQGVLFDDSTQNNSIICCLFDHCGQAGVKIKGGFGVMIKNCVFYNCQNTAIISLSVSESSRLFSLINSVIIGSKTGVFIKGAHSTIPLSHNLFWKNSKDVFDPSHNVKNQNAIYADPLFVAPEHGNFRPMSTSFGHEMNSPLLQAGTPREVSIGLYP